MEPGEDEPSVPLATRIPKALHRKLKLHCVITETAVMDFVTSAVREKLARSEGAPEATKRKDGPPAVPPSRAVSALRRARADPRPFRSGLRRGARRPLPPALPVRASVGRAL
jgi:hypothetical protein